VGVDRADPPGEVTAADGLQPPVVVTQQEVGISVALLPVGDEFGHRRGVSPEVRLVVVPGHSTSARAVYSS
jgi:hypothetical protein